MWLFPLKASKHVRDGRHAGADRSIYEFFDEGWVGGGEGSRQEFKGGVRKRQVVGNFHTDKKKSEGGSPLETFEPPLGCLPWHFIGIGIEVYPPPLEFCQPPPPLLTIDLYIPGYGAGFWAGILQGGGGVARVGPRELSYTDKQKKTTSGGGG